MSAIRTIDFLPSFFRTNTNKKVLSSTLDHLISEPKYENINGFIGRKNSPAFSVKDGYVIESTKNRQSYQLEPSLIVNSSDGKISSVTTFVDFLESLESRNISTVNQSLLFQNEYYSYDGCFDYDKLINFANYYWVPEGPDSVDIFTSLVPLQDEFLVNKVNTVSDFANSETEGYDTTSYDMLPLELSPEKKQPTYASIIKGKSLLNQSIKLVRGGKYVFKTDNIDKLWIQTEVGLGNSSIRKNTSTREILGVANNGSKEITFSVPLKSAQENFLVMEKVFDIDLVSEKSFREIQGKTFSEIAASGGIDGQRSITARTIIFWDMGSDSDWDTGGFYDSELSSYDNLGFDYSRMVPPELRGGVWQINSGSLNDKVQLSYIGPVSFNQKVSVKEGSKYGGREVFKNVLNRFELIPVLSSILDTLYYQDGDNPEVFGTIELVDPSVTEIINVDKNILGKKTYISPNGVEFTNGLKVKFDSNVHPASYANQEFYVEGVGKNIVLVPAKSLVTPEQFNNNISLGFDETPFDFLGYSSSTNSPTDPAYFTINRSSKDGNSWSRGNRWTHESVLLETAKYNNVPVNLANFKRASRPIIEFDANIKLFNHGITAKEPVDLIDTRTEFKYEVPIASRWASGDEYVIPFGYMTKKSIPSPGHVIVSRPVDIFSLLEGQEIDETLDTETLSSIRISSPEVDGVGMSDGMRVIFSNDTDPQVKNKIFLVSFIRTQRNGRFRIKFKLASDSESQDGDGIVVLFGQENQGKSYHFENGSWNPSQQRTQTLQAPLFDVVDSNMVSLANIPSSTFSGTKIFGYKIGTGIIDSVLKFPLSYRSIQNIGDIVFENFYSTDTFQLQNEKKNVSDYYLKLLSGGARNQWSTVAEDSKQYQVFSFDYEGSNRFQIDVVEDVTTITPNTRVKVNGIKIDSDLFFFTFEDGKIFIEINREFISRDRIVVEIYNPLKVSSSAFYEVPLNLESNAKNQQFQSLTLGQLRNHIQAAFENTTQSSGNFPGVSNLRDIDIKSSPGKILSHSAPLVYAMLFGPSAMFSLEAATRAASKDYQKIKYKILELASQLSINDEKQAVAALDEILLSINSFKNSSMPWFSSDMIPYGDSKTILRYQVGVSLSRSYELSEIFDDSIPSDKSVLIYLNGKQLLKSHNYEFDKTRPAVNILESVPLTPTDLLEIIEYETTDGCWIPETPTKLGLYPSYKPELRLDRTTRSEPTFVIVGHDGSETPAFNDSRDWILMEFEKRIFNNLKVKYDQLRFDINQVTPGKFKNNKFFSTNFTTFLASEFYSWLGKNKLELNAYEFYNNSDGFTWNYSKFLDKIDNEPLLGFWKGIYSYYFDCQDPGSRPWEMLGFSEMPSWWENFYGPAPYTSGNAVLWKDLEQGRIRFGERAGIQSLYARPGLTNFIPVDDGGNLLSPHEFILAKYEVRNTSQDFVFGDISPVESAWRKTSEYPYSVQLALAAAMPAKFYGLQLDTFRYKKDHATNQYSIVSTNSKISTPYITFNGEVDETNNIQRSCGYLNWIVDYARSLGNMADLKEKLNYNIQLSYKLSGFSDKSLLKLFAEQSSPNSIGNSILIPDSNFHLYLSKSPVVKEFRYSALILTRTSDGWKIDGYDLEKPFFNVLENSSSPNRNTFSYSGSEFTVAESFSPELKSVPYGTEFFSRQQVIDFISAYASYLANIGVIFEDRSRELSHTLDWTLSVKEFVVWSNQGWRPGSILVLNPLANSIKVANNQAMLDEMNNNNTFGQIIDINFNSIKTTDMSVMRLPDQSQIEIDSAIGFAKLPMVQYEHVLVLDNTTEFNDVIYQPEIGNRQFRIKISGRKTADWNGSLYAPGFVLSKSETDSWAPGRDYKKGDIVNFKSRNYVAKENIDATEDFDFTKWILSDFNQIKEGLLPNFASRATMPKEAYDFSNINLKNSISQQASSVIGFRQRSYFNDVGLQDSSQLNFYKGFVKQKGTLKSLDKFTSNEFNRISSDIVVSEDWAFRVGEYGDIAGYDRVDFSLSEANGSVMATSHMTSVGLNAIKLFGDTVVSKTKQTDSFVLPRKNIEDAQLSVGYVNAKHVDHDALDFDNISTLIDLNEVKRNQIILVALDSDRDWMAYQVQSLQTTVTGFLIEGSTVSLSYTPNRNKTDIDLDIGSRILVKNLTSFLDGFYVVETIDRNQKIITVSSNASNLGNLEVPDGNSGILYKLEPVRYKKNIPLDKQWDLGTKIWIDSERLVFENKKLFGSNEHYLEFIENGPTAYEQVIYCNQTAIAFSKTYFTVRSPSWEVPRLLYLNDLHTGRIDYDGETYFDGEIYFNRESFSDGKIYSDGECNLEGHVGFDGETYSDGKIYSDGEIYGLYQFGSKDLDGELYNSAEIHEASAEFIIAKSFGADKFVILSKYNTDYYFSIYSIQDVAHSGGIAAPYINKIKSFKVQNISDKCNIRNFCISNNTLYAPGVDYIPSTGTSAYDGQTFITEIILDNTDLQNRILGPVIEGYARSTFGKDCVINGDQTLLFVSDPATGVVHKVEKHRVLTATEIDYFSFAFTEVIDLKLQRASGLVHPGYDLAYYNNENLLISSDVEYKNPQTLITTGAVQVLDNIIYSKDSITIKSKDQSGLLNFSSSMKLIILGKRVTISETISDVREFVEEIKTQLSLDEFDGTIKFPTGELRFTKNEIVLQALSFWRGQPLLQFESYQDCQQFQNPEGFIYASLVEKQLIVPHKVSSSAVRFGFDIQIDGNSLIIFSKNQDYVSPIAVDRNETTFDDSGTLLSAIAYQANSTSFYQYVNGSYLYNSDLYLDEIQNLSGYDDVVDFSKFAKNIKFLPLELSNDEIICFYTIDYIDNGVVTTHFRQENLPKLTNGWTILPKEQQSANSNLITEVFSYNVVDCNDKTVFGMVEPHLGKLIPVVDEIIDVVSDQDPADYSTWGQSQVGHIWWDSSLVRWYDNRVIKESTLEETILERKRNWNKTVSGSRIKFYEWVKSSVLPSDWPLENPNNGFARDASNFSYAQDIQYDDLSGEFKTFYYYWVESKVTPAENKNMSVASAENICNSQNFEGIPYFYVLDDKTIQLENTPNNRDIAISVSYKTREDVLPVHYEYEIVTEFAEKYPKRVVDKILQSLTTSVGEDLKEFDRYGIMSDQTLYRDRKQALSVLVTYVNNYFAQNAYLFEQPNLDLLNIQEPVPLSGFDDVVQSVQELSYLTPSDGLKVLVNEPSGAWSVYEYISVDDTWQLNLQQRLNFSKYWKLTDWIKQGFDNPRKTTYVVRNKSEIQSLSLSLSDTVLVKNSSTYEIYEKTSLGVEIIYSKNATVEFLHEIYQDLESSSLEIAEFVKFAFSYFESIGKQTEIVSLMISVALRQLKNQDWIFKSSYLSIKHNVRRLDQYPTYQKDNVEFVEQYINEAKPYRSKIREYVLSYDKSQILNTHVTDFDLPGYYDTDFKRFRSPSGENVKDQELWQTAQYVDWYNTRAYKIKEIVVVNGGSGYTVPPRIQITGGNGSGASAVARIFDGRIIAVDVLRSGEGYTALPTIEVIGGNGQGAKLSVIVDNATVRKIKTKIKFDRFRYKKTDDWAEGKAYRIGDLVFLNGKTYRLLVDLVDLFTVKEYDERNEYNVGDIVNRNNTILRVQNYIPRNKPYESTDFVEVLAEEKIGDIDALDRTNQYYQPLSGMVGNNLNQIFSGLEYTGVKVQGAKFDEDFDRSQSGELLSDNRDFEEGSLPILSNKKLDTIIKTAYLDLENGVTPEMIIDGGKYVDVFSSHSPEELVPGIIFDTLDMKVYTVSALSPQVPSSSDIHSFVFEASNIEFDLTLPGKSNDWITVTTRLSGRLTENIDYVYDRNNRKLILQRQLPANDLLYVYLLGDSNFGKVLDQEYISNGEKTYYYSGLTAGQITSHAVYVNGILDARSVVSTSSGGRGIEVSMSSTPNVGDYIRVFLFSYVPNVQAFSYPVSQQVTFSGSYLIDVQNSITNNRPLDQNVIVELDGSRLRPPNNIYYSGNGHTSKFKIPTSAQINVSAIKENEIEVYVSGRRLRLGDASLVNPGMLTDTSLVDVGFDYYIDFSQPIPEVVLLPYAIPSEGSELSITVFTDSDYRVVNSSQILLTPSLTIREGSTVTVYSLGNHDSQKKRTQVFFGNTSQTVDRPLGFDRVGFDSLGDRNRALEVIETIDLPVFDRFGHLAFDSDRFDFEKIQTLVTVFRDPSASATSGGFDGTGTSQLTSYEYKIQNPAVFSRNDNPNSSYVWVYLNGTRLQPNVDYIMKDFDTILMGRHLTFTSSDTIVIDIFNQDVLIQPVGFRIFKSMTENDPKNYLTTRISKEETARLSRPLSLGDNEIYFDSVAGLPVPNPDLASPGIITINSEIITYYTIDYVNNKIGRLRRAAFGTGAPEVHASGSLAVDVSANQSFNHQTNKIHEPDNTNNVSTKSRINLLWTSGFGSGIGIGNSSESNFLKQKPSFLPS